MITGSLTIRTVPAADRPAPGGAIATLQEFKRRLHATRRPGEQIAGAILVAGIDATFAGFVAGCSEEAENAAETADSNRSGLISDICIMPEFRGQRVTARLLGEIEQYLRHGGPPGWTLPRWRRTTPLARATNMRASAQMK